MQTFQASWPDDQAIAAWPERIPDLYAGEPVLLAVRLERLQGKVIVSGRLGKTAWRRELVLQGGSHNEGTHVLWARRKIAALLDGAFLGKPQEQIRAQVVETALNHHLVSRYTSLVAVDVTPTRPADQGLQARAMATNLPHGWTYDKVFGALPQTATAAPLQLLIGLLALLFGTMLLWRKEAN